VHAHRIDRLCGDMIHTRSTKGGGGGGERRYTQPHTRWWRPTVCQLGIDRCGRLHHTLYVCWSGNHGWLGRGSAGARLVGGVGRRRHLGRRRRHGWGGGACIFRGQPGDLGTAFLLPLALLLPCNASVSELFQLVLQLLTGTTTRSETGQCCFPAGSQPQCCGLTLRSENCRNPLSPGGYTCGPTSLFNSAMLSVPIGSEARSISTNVPATLPSCQTGRQTDRQVATGGTDLSAATAVSSMVVSMGGGIGCAQSAHESISC
jgi:hypothetical protein